jgi:hypothetical protein
MGQTITLTMPDGSAVEATELDFKSKADPWTVLDLEDGTTLRIRPDVDKMYRLSKFNPATGEPIYYFTSNNLVRTNVPLKLRQRGVVATSASDPQGLYG